jgi:pimeloyl-ACP methyl ester carboxylesterase
MERERYMLPVRNGLFETEVYEYGDKSADPLLFLHPSNGLMRDPYLDDLGAQFRVIAPCHPGWGDSTGLEHIDDPVDMAIYYYDFLDALGIESAHVVGHSIGGMFAAEIAAIDPHRVRKLVLNNAVGLWRDDTPVLDFSSEAPVAVAQAVIFDLRGESARSMAPDTSDIQNLMDAMYTRIQSLGAAAKFLWPIPDRGLAKRIHRVTAPTLLVWGKSDGLVSPVYAEEFAKRLSGPTRTLILARSAHFPMQEQRAEWSKAVLEFLGS